MTRIISKKIYFQDNLMRLLISASQPNAGIIQNDADQFFCRKEVFIFGIGQILVVLIYIVINLYACIVAKHKGRRTPLRRVQRVQSSDFESTETKLFRAGLKHYTANHERLIKGTRNSPNQGYHDHIDYERGCIIHSRSPANQRFNFHYMYGGVKKFFVDRWLVGSIYRNGFRIMWFPGFLFFIFGCYGMRLYDNAAHDFFYFSD